MNRTPAYPPSTLTFDWVMGILAVVLMGGVAQDGWAHSHGLVDQSFFTHWHAILYATIATNGIVLGAMATRNVLRGYPLRCALPFGYWTSLAGVIIFATGGIFDLYWHGRYGIESDINALVSPAHLWLGLGFALVFVGPIRSIAFRFGTTTGGWKVAGPAIFGALATMILLGFVTQYAQPIGSADEWQIIGKQEESTGGALYAVRRDGSHETRLLTIPRADIWGVAASPDRKRVAFRVGTGRSPQSDIYVANADGTKARRVTHSGRHDTQVAWSPDGTRLAFVSIPAGTSRDFLLQTIKPDGSELRAIVESTIEVQFPAWSPDGKWIAFQSRNGLHQQIAIVSNAGGTPRWLPVTSGGAQPAWSSNNAIAFVTSEGAISVTHSRGLTARTIVSNGEEPAWSPDSRQLAYIADAAGDSQVFVTDANGNRPVNVSQLSGLNASRPAWAGGGLLFTATGRPPVATTFIGLAYSEDANLVQAIVVTGVLLFLIRRWRMPLGAMTLLLGLFAVALAFQSDLYFEIYAAVVTGVLTDIAIAILGERARGGFGFYALGFAIPCVLFAAYLLTEKAATGALGWPPNMIFGSPLIAGFAGLVVAFCFAPPLRSGEESGALT